MRKKTLLTLALLALRRARRAGGQLRLRNRRVQYHHRLDGGHREPPACFMAIGATGAIAPGTVTTGSNIPALALGNNVQLSLTTDGTSSNFAATLALINTSTSGGWGNALEVYGNIGGTYSLNTYINNAGIFYSTLNMVISGHYSSGSGSGGHYGGGFSVLSPNNNYPNMYGCWADITGSCYQARNNTGAVGELSFSGQTHSGVFTIGLDAENSQFILGNTTITASGQVFTGDTFIARARRTFASAARRERPSRRRSAFRTCSPARATPPASIRSSSLGGTGTGVAAFSSRPRCRDRRDAQNAFVALTIDGAMIRAVRSSARPEPFRPLPTRSPR